MHLHGFTGKGGVYRNVPRIIFRSYSFHPFENYLIKKRRILCTVNAWLPEFSFW